MTVRDAVESAIRTARALSAAHNQGIVHRDLKPENLFLTRDGQLKVLDFGLARLTSLSATELDSLMSTESDTKAGTVLGTVGYMAPEQVRGEEADARADIFSLGVVLYELLARRPPFRRASAAETMSAVLRDDPPPLDSSPGNIPPALAGIVDRCLAKRAEDRFQSAHDLALALEAVSSPSWPDASAQAAPENRSQILKKAAVASIAALALVGGGLAIRHFAWRAPEADPALSPAYHRGTAASTGQGGGAALRQQDRARRARCPQSLPGRTDVESDGRRPGRRPGAHGRDRCGADRHRHRRRHSRGDLGDRPRGSWFRARTTRRARACASRPSFRT